MDPATSAAVQFFGRQRFVSIEKRVCDILLLSSLLSFMIMRFVWVDTNPENFSLLESLNDATPKFLRPSPGAIG